MKSLAAGLRYVSLQLGGAVCALVIAAVFGSPAMRLVMRFGDIFSFSNPLRQAMGRLVFYFVCFAAAVGYAHLLQGRLLPRGWLATVGVQILFAAGMNLGVGCYITDSWNMNIVHFLGLATAMGLVVVASALFNRACTWPDPEEYR